MKREDLKMLQILDHQKGKKKRYHYRNRVGDSLEGNELIKLSTGPSLGGRHHAVRGVEGSGERELFSIKGCRSQKKAKKRRGGKWKNFLEE